MVIGLAIGRGASSKARRRSAAGLLVALGLTLSAAAHAQRTTAEKAAAETLFDKGLKQLEANDLKGACRSFEQSQRVDPAVGTLLYLAECYERTGRSASAWVTFREASSLARELRQSERAEIGEARAKRLEPLLARLTIRVADEAVADLTLTSDGVPVPRALLGVPTPVDPGPHTLVAEAPGYQRWEQSIVIENTPQETEVIVPPLVANVVPEPASAPVTSSPPETTSPAPPPPIRHGVNHAPSWILGGVGLLSVSAGVLLSLRAHNLDDQAKEYCVNNRCFDRQGETLSNRAQSMQLLSVIGFATGGVCLATSALLYVLTDDEESTADALTLEANPRFMGLNYRGAF